MDRNSVIGLSLIAILLIIYFYFFSPTPSPVPEESKPANTETAKPQQADRVVPDLDSASAEAYSKLSGSLGEEEKVTVVGNNDLSIGLSSKGRINTIELKQFRTYDQKPLLLAMPDHNSFQLLAKIDGNDVDLYKLNYVQSSSTRGDTSVITFTAAPENSRFIRHTYLIPRSGYQVGYELETAGMSIQGDMLTYLWRDNIPLVEKDITDSRVRTTVNYYTMAGEFDNISENSLDFETQTIAEPLKWAAIRQKFFVSAIIARRSFKGGEISTVSNAADATHVKDASVKLFIPAVDVSGRKATFTYYFGPNEYDVLGDVAPAFSRNLYLGWPPVVWVNKYLIMPIFNFLKSFMGNFGVVIFFLVLIIRLILTPLSYKSYLGMAKMKLLKPELDLIKEKNGDNMTQAQQDQMKLYQQAGVNPFSGCIPLLLQMPILLSMFYFFPVSIDLRQEHFLWAEDLSTYDSILDLPFTIPFYGDHVSLFVLLMTISTLISTWQNNQLTTVQGPMKSMGYIMPVIFMFVLNNFSAGLSYYYFVSNLLTFAQQAIIRRFVNEDKIMAVMDDHKKKYASGGGTGKKSKFMAKLEEAMKASEEARKKSPKK